MESKRNKFLITGAALSAAAALLHVACMVFGGPMYRFVGAGEAMAQMADAGHWYPTVTAATIASVLVLWSLYALSAANVIRRLPLLRTVLCIITGIYLLRAMAFPLLTPHFPDNTLGFWLWSSGICLTFGIIHFVGLRHAWPDLRQEPGGVQR